MPPDAYRGRMLLPAEVRRILRRAAELDEAAGAPHDGGRGHTLDEVERIASDAGISEGALRRALDGEEPARRPKRPWSFAGAPGKISIERTVRGGANAASHAKLTRAMRGALGELGSAQAVGDSLSWSTSSVGGRSVSALVEPDGEGRVTIRVDENLRSLRGALFGGIMGGAGGGGFGLVVGLVAALAQPALMPLALFAWVFLCYLVARSIYVNRFRAREAEVQKLVDEVAALIETPGARVAADEGAVAGARVLEARGEEVVEEDGGGEGEEERKGAGGKAG